MAHESWICYSLFLQSFFLHLLLLLFLFRCLFPASLDSTSFAFTLSIFNSLLSLHFITSLFSPPFCHSSPHPALSLPRVVSLLIIFSISLASSLLSLSFNPSSDIYHSFCRYPSLSPTLLSSSSLFRPLTSMAKNHKKTRHKKRKTTIRCFRNDFPGI